MNSIKILLCDFQFLTREGLERMLTNQEEFNLVATVEDLLMLRSEISNKEPEVVLLDIKENFDNNGLFQLIEECQIPFLVITNNYGHDYVKNLVDIGVRGILTKECSKKEILEAIHSVHKGNRFFCNRMIETVVAKPPAISNCDPVDLSPREFEVLRLITRGLKTLEIADELHLSHHTINTHRKNILKKLNLKSPAELIVYAMENQILKHDKDHNFA